MKKILYRLLVGTVILLTGCESWLDVQPRTKIKSDDLFETEAGFKDALVGVYTLMKSEPLYGREMTFGFVEVLTNGYGYNSTYANAAKWNYTDLTVRPLVDNIWSKMYNTLANVNNLLDNIDSHKDVFTGDNYNIIKGEALGLRQDCSRKFHNFIGSSFAVRRLSDRVCIEHDLSVIQNPKQHSKGRYLHYGQWIGEKPPSAKQRVRLAIVESLQKQPADFPAFLRLMEESGFLVKHGRGGVISFLAPGQDKPTRLRASTLGDGFDPEDIRAVIAGERPIPELPQEAPAPARRVNLIIDIQERMAQGKGPAYERWAKVYNLKQMAAALQYLRENDLMDYEALAASTEKAVERFHTLSEELRQTEAELEKTSGLMAATVDYAKTRPVFDGYKAARYSKKYLSEHEAELAAYRAARATMNELLDGAKLPKMADMKKSRQELAGKKKALYAEYRKAQADMRQAVAVKANIDHLLGVTDGQHKKEQER